MAVPLPRFTLIQKRMHAGKLNRESPRLHQCETQNAVVMGTVAKSIQSGQHFQVAEKYCHHPLVGYCSQRPISQIWTAATLCLYWAYAILLVGLESGQGSLANVYASGGAGKEVCVRLSLFTPAIGQCLLLDSCTMEWTRKGEGTFITVIRVKNNLDPINADGFNHNLKDYK